MNVPSAEMFKVTSRNPRGWVKDFVENLVPNTPTLVPYTVKSAANMIRTEALKQGKRVGVTEFEGNTWAMLMDGES